MCLYAGILCIGTVNKSSLLNRNFTHAYIFTHTSCKIGTDDQQNIFENKNVDSLYCRLQSGWSIFYRSRNHCQDEDQCQPEINSITACDYYLGHISYHDHIKI